MTAERLPFFLAHAREWWAASDALRAAGAREDDPALGVWREAAWCHLLFGAGKYTPVLARLRHVCRGVTGASPPAVPVPAGELEALDLAADLFARMRDAVCARFPAAFGRPAAA
jgi:hypothetical protein